MTADAEEPGEGQPRLDPAPGGASAPDAEGLAGRPAVIAASSMDSITLPERSRHEGAGRPIRRRRSAVHTPVVVTPIDVPEDAAGRVEIFAVRAPEDPVTVPARAAGESHGTDSSASEDRGVAPEPGTAEEPGGAPAPARGERLGWSQELLALREGWVVVLLLAALLAALFVLGDLFTR